MRKLLSFCLLISFTTMAQVNTNALRAMAYAEAQKQGVNPQALEQRLIDRGIDVNTR